jgi:hypothetical protein
LFAVDPDGDTLTFAGLTQPTHGTLALNSTGTLTYVPTPNFSGTDSFTYRVNDGLAISNVGTVNITVSPVNDPMTLTFPSATTKVARNSSPVRLDAAATLIDVDDNIDFTNAQIRALVSTGNSKGDYEKGRIALKVLSQGKGPNQVQVVGSNIYYNDDDVHPVATFTGGTLGRALVIKFRSAADIFAVNAVLRQISFVASKKATSTTSTAGVGIRLVDVTVSAGGQRVLTTKTVSVI